MSSDIVDRARRCGTDKKLKYLWILFVMYVVRILISFVPSLLLGLIGFLISSIFYAMGINFMADSFNFVIGLLESVVAYVSFLISGPVLFGGLSYLKNETEGVKNTESIFKFMHLNKTCAKMIGMTFILSFGTIFGLLFLIVPGVIYISNRIMAPYILLENPEMGVLDAIIESKEIMNGRRSDLYWIVIKLFWPALATYILGNFVGHFGGFLAFLGWVISCLAIALIAFGLVDFLLALPIFFNKIKGRKKGAIDVEFREVEDEE